MVDESSGSYIMAMIINVAMIITMAVVNLRAGTSVTYTRKSLGPRRGLLDNMVAAKVLRIVGGHYVPTFGGIEQLDDDIGRVVRENLNCVIGSLQR